MNYDIKTKFLSFVLFLLSRPLLFGFFYKLNKACLQIMNRVSASFLLPNDSGERVAFEFSLKYLKPYKKLLFFDVGANRGDYLKMIKEICTCKKIDFSVQVFEPSFTCFSCLLEENKNEKNIVVNRLALAEQDGFSELYSPWDGSSGASLAKLDYFKFHMSNADISSETVNTVSLDSFCERHSIERIDFLKLDIEGFELSALRGSHNMLTSKRIKFIQIEIGSASLTTKSMLFDFWQMLSDTYQFYLILNQGLVEIKEYKSDLECFYGASNFLLQLKE